MINIVLTALFGPVNKNNHLFTQRNAVSWSWVMPPEHKTNNSEAVVNFTVWYPDVLNEHN